MEGESILTRSPDLKKKSVKEYEEGTSPEAILVKDLDKFDMIFQAFEYENCEKYTPYLAGYEIQYSNPLAQGHDLQEFFDHTRGAGLPFTQYTFYKSFVQGDSNTLW